MWWLKGILQNLYAFFGHNPKKFAKFLKLVDLIKMKGSKLLQNVNTR
jgi:hypothetical protein